MRGPVINKADPDRSAALYTNRYEAINNTHPQCFLQNHKPALKLLNTPRQTAGILISVLAIRRTQNVCTLKQRIEIQECQNGANLT